ncbi:MAG: radical SAM protein [Pelagibacteraceae bacterium TMED65]|nr:MAG: radical SAM protein [Pelagibacteraceae bacterium TMED65]
MDKFLIDSHKYAFHPEHSSTVLKYYNNPELEVNSKEFRQLMPLYIEVSPVGACNHRCTFCAVDYIGYKSVFLDLETYKQSVKSISGHGTKSIMFAGEGEPLLHPEISNMVNFTREECNIDVSFTTNAVRLEERFVKNSLHNVSWIKVSFNGGDENTYSNIHRTNKKDFQKVLDNIEYAIRYKKENNIECAIGLQTLLLPDNKDSISNLCIKAKNIGADYVVIKPYSQHKFSNTHTYENIDYSEYLDMQGELEAFSDENFSVIFRINTINNWISQNEERYCKCMATPSVWAYIMASGDVYSCSAYLLDERFNLGSINEKDFYNLWSSQKRLDNARFVYNDLDISECRVNCRMDQVNRYLDKISNQNVAHINFV